MLLDVACSVLTFRHLATACRMGVADTIAVLGKEGRKLPSGFIQRERFHIPTSNYILCFKIDGIEDSRR